MKRCLTILHEVHYTSSNVVSVRNSLALNFENMLSWVTGLIAMPLGINYDRSFFLSSLRHSGHQFHCGADCLIFFLTGWVRMVPVYQFLPYGNDLNSCDYHASAGTNSITQFQKISGSKQPLHLHLYETTLHRLLCTPTTALKCKNWKKPIGKISQGWLFSQHQHIWSFPHSEQQQAYHCWASHEFNFFSFLELLLNRLM